jgi:hypothetical protein
LSSTTGSENQNFGNREHQIVHFTQNLASMRYRSGPFAVLQVVPPRKHAQNNWDKSDPDEGDLRSSEESLRHSFEIEL